MEENNIERYHIHQPVHLKENKVINAIAIVGQAAASFGAGFIGTAAMGPYVGSMHGIKQLCAKVGMHGLNAVLSDISGKKVYEEIQSFGKWITDLFSEEAEESKTEEKTEE